MEDQRTEKVVSFVGRDRELEWLEDRLAFPTRLPLIVAGVAGSGKTTLVRDFFSQRRTRRLPPWDHVTPLWIDVPRIWTTETEASVSEYLRALHSARWDAIPTSDERSQANLPVVLDGFDSLPNEQTLENIVRQIFSLKLVGSAVLIAREPPRIARDRVLVLRALEPGDYGGLLLQSVVTLGPRVPEGHLVEAVAIPWFQIVDMMARDPAAIHRVDWRKWEEIIAGAYQAAGFEVILTPRSNDGGRDVIASRAGIGSIRFIDQVKAFAPGRLVKADDVRALIGALTLDRNVSKGILTTTSDFAPGVKTDPRIAELMPYRLELKGRDTLMDWLKTLAKRE